MGISSTRPWSYFWRILRQNRRAYLWLNVSYYGLVLCGMLWVARHPALEHALRTAVKANFNQQLLSAYSQGWLLPAIGLTFWSNFVLAALLALTLPSFLIPFWGVFLGAGRAFLWGLALAPADPSFGAKIISHSLTLLLEGQGYTLAMLAVYLLWRNAFWPGRAGLENREQGYRLGLQQTRQLYRGVIAFLAAAAVWEAVAAIYLVPLLP